MAKDVSFWSEIILTLWFYMVREKIHQKENTEIYIVNYLRWKKAIPQAQYLSLAIYELFQTI